MRRIRIVAALLLVASANARAEPMQAMVSVCFVPGEACAGRIAEAIEAARREVRVQAYGFTARPILRALAAARRRGVDVAVILDRSDRGEVCRASAAVGDLMAAGVPVWIDPIHGIAHNKVMVIDRHLVIGGSYNYTEAAERRNAENVTFIDSSAVASRFLTNWETRRSVAQDTGAACAAP